MSENHYDLVVIGSGPAGQKCAIAAAKLDKKVAVIDRKEMIGGVTLHTGTNFQVPDGDRVRRFG